MPSRCWSDLIMPRGRTHSFRSPHCPAVVAVSRWATNGIATEGTATEAIATNGIATEGIATNGTSSGQFSLTGRRKRGEIRSRKNKGMANIQKAGFIRPLN